jgi:hypothetical protein
MFGLPGLAGFRVKIQMVPPERFIIHQVQQFGNGAPLEGCPDEVAAVPPVIAGVLDSLLECNIEDLLA